MKSTLRDKINAGVPVQGAIIGFTSATVVELAAAAGFDFVVVDTEHGAISADSMADMIRAANSFGTEVVVRVGTNARAPIQVALDAGAIGIQVPMVESAAEAAQIVRFSRYAPDGLRGMAGNRAAGYRPMTADLLREANRSVIVIAQVETVEGARNAAEICAVDGVDVLFVGPTDLSQSLGVPGDLEAPEVTSAIDGIVAANAGRKRMGILARSPEVANGYARQGFGLFEVAASSLAMTAFSAYAAATAAGAASTVGPAAVEPARRAG